MKMKEKQSSVRTYICYSYGVFLTLAIFAGCVTLHVGSWYDYPDIQKLFDQNGTRSEEWESLVAMDNLIPPMWIHSFFLANYAAQLLWILYAFTMPCRDDIGRPIIRKAVSVGVLALFVMSMGCIIAWLFLWDRGWFNYSVILMFGASVYAYLALFVSMRATGKEHSLMRMYTYGDLIAVRLLVHNGLGVQSTFCLSIAFYQICEILSLQGLIQTDLVYVFICSLFAVMFLSFIAESCDCGRLHNYVMTSYMVVIVECVAIIIQWFDSGKSISEPKHMGVVVCCGIIIALCFILSLIKLGVTYQRESRAYQRFEPTGPKTTVASFANSGYGKFDADVESTPGTDIMDAKTRSSFVADSDYIEPAGAQSETTLENANIVHFGGARTLGEDDNLNSNNGYHQDDGEALLSQRSESPEMGVVNEGLMSEEEKEAEQRKITDYLEEDSRIGESEQIDAERASTSDQIEAPTPAGRWEAHLAADDEDDASSTNSETGEAQVVTNDSHVTFEDTNDVSEQRHSQIVSLNDEKRSSQHSDTDANMLSNREHDFDNEPVLSNGHIIEEE